MTNSDSKRIFKSRSFFMVLFFIVICVGYVGRLVYLQVAGQDYYSMAQKTSYYERTVAIKAQRGEIYDRHGVPLVENKYSYDIRLDYATLPNDNKGINDIILNILSAAERRNEKNTLTIPAEIYMTAVSYSGNDIDFIYNSGFDGTAKAKRLDKLLGELNVDENAMAYEQARSLLSYYGIITVDKDGNATYNYTPEDAMYLFRYRLDMTLSNFSSAEPYIMAQDVSVEYLTDCKELIPRGISVNVSAEREYMYQGYLSHILGRVGKIQSGYEDYYTSLGYSLNAVVGISGVEAAFEDYLRGVDGEMKITEDAYGNIVSTEVTLEPVAGKDVYLTIDMDMQVVAENALAENIFKIRREALMDGKPLSGEDASAGALTAVEVDSGAILAIASYPTYNLTTFNEDYAALSEDETYPMFNRALNGTYAPGSTFKVGVAVAALTEGIIEKNTFIIDKGIYDYYDSYQPRCWLYLLGKDTHGPINVVEAIQESCNYFFYEVGRLLTIQKMNEYDTKFGLGMPTGIELSEKTGVLAGPDYRDENGLDQWNPGDTLQAAIGQSDNLFTPLQITMYITTVLNRGTRYAAHLLYKVNEFGSDESIYTYEKNVLDSFEIKNDVLDTVKEGMRNVMDNGSAARVFSGYEVTVGGKTGTAQVHENKSDNGIITVFAPFEKPEIAVTCIIEQAAGGTSCGYAVRDLFDYYFGIGAWAPQKEEDESNTNNYDNDYGYSWEDGNNDTYYSTGDWY